MYNLNSGYGQLFAQALSKVKPTFGKLFFVVPTTHPNYQEISDTFGRPDEEGLPRVYANITDALAACVASRGDKVLVAEGYTQTITSATGIALNKAGVEIIGLGTGSLRPTITYGTNATANIPVTAANVNVRNFVFVSNKADVVSAFTLTTAPEFVIDSCEFRDTSSILNFLACVTTTVSVNADGLTFTNNRVQMLGTTAGTTPVKVAGTIARLTIDDNYVIKAVLNNTSCLLAHGALVVTGLEMARNRVFSANTDSATGGLLITTSATTNTGMVFDNKVQALDVAAAILVTSGCNYGMFNNLYDGDANASGFVLPAIGTDA